MTSQLTVKAVEIAARRLITGIGVRAREWRGEVRGRCGRGTRVLLFACALLAALTFANAAHAAMPTHPADAKVVSRGAMPRAVVEGLPLKASGTPLATLQAQFQWHRGLKAIDRGVKKLPSAIRNHPIVKVLMTVVKCCGPAYTIASTAWEYWKGRLDGAKCVAILRRESATLAASLFELGKVIGRSFVLGPLIDAAADAICYVGGDWFYARCCEGGTAVKDWTVIRCQEAVTSAGSAASWVGSWGHSASTSVRYRFGW